MDADTIARIRELAQKATHGDWYLARVTVSGPQGTFQSPVVAAIEDKYSNDPDYQPEIVAEQLEESDALYIAAVNPSAVLELLADLERVTAAGKACAEALAMKQVDYGWSQADDPYCYWCDGGYSGDMSPHPQMIQHKSDCPRQLALSAARKAGLLKEQ